MAKLGSTLNFASKKATQVFWSVSFLKGRPPKIPTFSGSDPEGLKRGPRDLARWRNFKNILRTIVVLQWGYNPSTFCDVSRQNPQCPTQKTKKMPFLPILAPFSTKWLAHCSFQHETSPNQLIFQPHCRTEILRKVF